jgi:hypothetical protein
MPGYYRKPNPLKGPHRRGLQLLRADVAAAQQAAQRVGLPPAADLTPSVPTFSEETRSA